MPRITTDNLADILLGTELSGNRNKIYEVNFAVPNSLLGISRGDNNSGFSFGIVQLDIGNNGIAQDAHRDILNDALAAGAIDRARFDSLIAYNGKSRYDLNPTLSATYRADQRFLNSTIFTRQGTKDIVDSETDRYLEESLLGQVQNFLNAMTAAWGTDSVFDDGSDDYHLAVAAMTSISNRTGGLTQSTAHFEANQPESIADVRARFNAIFRRTHVNDWQLVEIGARLFEDSGAGTL